MDGGDHVSVSAQGTGVSVVIPAAGRVRLLEELLLSVSVARAALDAPSEVLVLDNSPEAERPAVQRATETYGASYQTGSDNLSEKRNQGARLARYDIILYLDSDCAAAPDLLVQHYRTLAPAAEGAARGGRPGGTSLPGVAGCLGVVEFTGLDTFVWQAVERTGVTHSFAMAKFRETANWGPTANISFRREAFEAVKGFDPDFARPGGEDVDLGFRLENSGWHIVCNPAAVVCHAKDTWASLGQVFRRFWAYGQADALLIRKHRDRTVPDMPTPTHIATLTLIFSGFAALLTREAGLLLVPLVWAALAHALYGGLSLRHPARTRSFREWALRVTAFTLLGALDLGRLVGSLRLGEPGGLYRRVVFFKEQQVMDWTDVATSALASTVALGATLLGAAWVLAL